MTNQVPVPVTSIDSGLAKPTRPGKAPKQRLSKPEDAYCIAATLIHAAIPRVEKGRMVRGLLDGNPPRSPGRLKSQGQDWRTNFNTLEGRSIANNAKTPYHDLFSSTMPLIEVDLDTDDAARDSYNAVSAEEFHCMLYSYPSFESVLWTMLDDFVIFNKGFLFWPNPDDPWFKRMEWWRVMFPNATPLDSAEWSQFAVRQYFTATKLWQLSGEGQAPRWNGSGVIGAIRRAQALWPNSQQAEGIDVQQQLKDCDLLLSARSEVIRTTSIFTKEYDGKWSWQMIEEDAAMSTMPEYRQEGYDDHVPAFLFNAPRIFDSPQEILAPFIYEAEEGSINAFSGLGKHLYQLLRAKDIIEMGLLDGAILRQYPMLQPADAGSAQRASLLQLGPMHVLSPGVNVVQTNLLADIEGSLAVMQHLEQQVESNTAIFKPRIEKPQGNPETATAANLRWQNATVLTSSAVNRFYAQGDEWIAEVWRRATADLPSSNRPGIKAARLFQERCKERGVPLDVLRKAPYKISLARAIGNGSPMARQQAVSALMPLVPEMGPRGRRNFYTDYVSAFASAKKVERYFPKADVLNLPDTNSWMAEQENGYMRDDGAEPSITDGQDNRVHIKSHVMAMSAAIQAVQQGADPVAVLTFMPVARQHVFKHLQSLPPQEQKGWLEVIGPIWGAFEQLAREYQKQQEQAARRQQQANGMMSEQQLKLLEIQLDAQRKDAKNAAQMGQRQQRHQQDMALSDASTAAEITRQTATTATDIAAKRAKTAADIEATRIKAQAAANKPKPTKNDA